MENYNVSIRNGVHRVRVTLQQWKYKGHIWLNTGGNCYGRSIIDFDFDCVDDDLENDCNLVYEEEDNCFTAILKDDDGNECVVEGEADDFNNMIVAVEIIAYLSEEEYERGSSKPQN